MSGSRPSFRATASQRLAEDGGALSPAVEEFLSDTRRMAVRLLPLHLIDLRATREEAAGPDAAPLESLVGSVRQYGVLEPILVRPLDAGRYELVAGERRLRAARAAELETIPAVVREMDDVTAGELLPVAAAVAVGGAAGPVVTAEHPGLRSADVVRHAEPWRIGDAPRPRRTTNGTYMPPAVVTRREPVVISGPGIPGPSIFTRDADAAEANRRAMAAGDEDRRPRFRFAPFPFLRRQRDGSGGPR